MSADLVTIPLDDIGMAGAHHDPLAALFFCHVPRVRHSVVNGRVVVRDGELTTIDLPVHLELHNRLARELAESGQRGA
jgi:8-oxoguanine deaminase